MKCMTWKIRIVNGEKSRKSRWEIYRVERREY